MVGNNTKLLDDQHVFDIPHVRVMFILLYTLVFVFCFFGNLAVVLVVTFHSRMRNITKFFLGNLAFANLCVGVFCIYQSLTSFLYESWFYGDFMCKMYHFTQSLCHSASILILIAIAIERYLVLLYPFKARQMMTIRRLAVIILLLWVLSAAIASPRLYYFGTIKIPIHKKRRDTLCVPKKSLYDPATADTIYFVLLYAFPLTVITVLYVKIAQHLHRSVALRRQMSQVRTPAVISGECDSARARSSLRSSTITRKRFSSTSSSNSAASVDTTRPAKSKFRMFLCRCLPSQPKSQCNHTEVTFMTASSVRRPSQLLARKRSTVKRRNSSAASFSRQNSHVSRRSTSDSVLYCPEGKNIENKDQLIPLQTLVVNSGNSTSGCMSEIRIDRRRRLCTMARRILNARTRLDQRLYAVRILIVIVVTFAVLNLPFHVRKLCLNYLSSYNPDSDFNHLMTPCTFLMMYANCAINPILYAFLNKRFRQSLYDFFSWRHRKACRVLNP